VGEKTDSPRTIKAIFTKPSSILSRMKPTLKHSMSIFTCITSPARTLPEIRARYTAVMIPAWISPPSILTRMCKWALSPIMRICPRTRADLKGEHSELICHVDAIFNVRKRRIIVMPFLIFIMMLSKDLHCSHIQCFMRG
jgi:hypothetical protein